MPILREFGFVGEGSMKNPPFGDKLKRPVDFTALPLAPEMRILQTCQRRVRSQLVHERGKRLWIAWLSSLAVR